MKAIQSSSERSSYPSPNIFTVAFIVFSILSPSFFDRSAISLRMPPQVILPARSAGYAYVPLGCPQGFCPDPHPFHPVLVIKMLLLGFMEGIDSEKKLCGQVRLNIAYRWFLGLDFDDPTPEHSAFSQLRRRKWKNTRIFEEIFAGIVKQCIDYGLISLSP